MPRKQVSQNEFNVQAVAKAARAANQTMAAAGIPRQENARLKMSGSIIKQPTFNWSAKYKYEELWKL